MKCITVAICTYNRYEFLRGALEAVGRQTLPKERYEILVVDNTEDQDRRDAFAREFAGRPGLRIVSSSPPGLSRARNVALELCETDYIAYIDDDAVPSSEWLAALLEALESTEAAVVAGPILPVWPERVPDWLPMKYAGFLTILDLGPFDRPLRDNEFAYGTNMAFAVASLRVIGGFNVGMGRIGARTLLSEEEIEIQIALGKRGYKRFYAANAKLSHIVHKERMSRSYFRARASWQAVSNLLRDPPVEYGDWSRRVIGEASTTLGLEELVAGLLRHRDADTFSAQLDLIQHLLALFLASKDADDVALEEQFDALSRPATIERGRRLANRTAWRRRNYWGFASVIHAPRDLSRFLRRKRSELMQWVKAYHGRPPF